MALPNRNGLKIITETAMKLIGFGLNHKTAPLPLLERLSFRPEEIVFLLGRLREHPSIAEAFGLSTCNRTEFFVHSDDPQTALTALRAVLTESTGIDFDENAAHTYTYIDVDALRHLFQVACGIDSLVIGENEILGQLRRAREMAADAGHIGELMEPVLLRALDVGRRARLLTNISRGNVSVASVAATLASRHIGDLTDKTGLILGAGETGETAAGQLREHGLQNLIVVSRCFKNASLMANKVNARPVRLTDIPATLPDVDIVVCATGAKESIIHKPMVQHAMNQRPGRTLFLLDLSVPRNADPAIAELDNVHLYCLDDLRQVAEENRNLRRQQTDEVNVLIEAELKDFQASCLSKDTLHLVAALHRRIEQVRHDYVNRQSRHFGAELQPSLEAFSQGLTRSMLHELVANLRNLDLETSEGRQRFQLAQELFNILPDKAGK